MFKVKSIALASALYGLQHAQTAYAAGCYSGWTSGGSYTEGSMVSASVTTETAEVKETCTGTSNGCGSDGYRITTPASTVTEKYNFVCASGADHLHCPNRDPADPVHGSSVWSKESAVCSGTATAAEIAATLPAEWSGGGCPKAYVADTDYAPAAVVSAKMSGYTLVYRCTGAPSNAFCGMAGYEPGDSTYWADVWEELGTCDGSMSPTGSPVYTSLTSAGGCPGVYDLDEDSPYEPGDKVALDGLVYQCKGWPSSEYCKQAAFEPGTSVGEGAQLTEYWKQAWDVVGWCEGTITPTASPNFVSLDLMGGCPNDSWVAKTGEDAYEPGDKIAVNGLVFECKAWPFSGWCGTVGYEPLTNPATPNAWKDAWTLTGYCEGTIGPTSSPTFDALTIVDPSGCPREYSSSTTYEQGQLVSVTVSREPERKVVYQCSNGIHLHRYCSQFGPEEFGGNQGWTLKGHCDGTLAPSANPTASPSKSPSASPSKSPSKSPSAAPIPSPTPAGPPPTPAGPPPCDNGCACMSDFCVPGSGIVAGSFEGSTVCSCTDPKETQTASCIQIVCQ